MGILNCCGIIRAHREVVLRSPGRTRSMAYLLLRRVVGKRQQNSHISTMLYDGWAISTLVIIPGKLREASYKQFNANQFVSLLLQTKAIETIINPKSPYLLPSTLFCDVSLMIWTTTKETWAVCVVASMRGKSRCREVGFQTETKLPHFILSKQPAGLGASWQ